MSRYRVGIATLAVLFASISACATTPPVHPMGAGCTWPADLQPARDGLAVLLTYNPLYPSDPDRQELVLFDVGADAVLARCVGIEKITVPTTMSDYDINQFKLATNAEQGVALPPISSDYRLAVTPTAVVDLPSGRLIPAPDPNWPAVAMLGRTGVLREDLRTRPSRDVYDGRDANRRNPTDFCTAPTPDAPPDQCAPLGSASGPGAPVVGPAGGVEWARYQPAAPLTLSGTDGTTYTGLAQIADTQVISLYIELYPDTPELNLDGGYEFEPFSRAALPFDRKTLRDPSGSSNSSRNSAPIRWYRIDSVRPDQVTGTVYASTTTYRDLAEPCGDPFVMTSGYVLDPHNVILGCTAYDQPLEYRGEHYFIQITDDGPPKILGTLGVNGRRADPTILPQEPTIYFWPPVDSSDARP